MRLFLTLIVSLFLLSGCASTQLMPSDIPKNRITPQGLYLSPAQAHEMVTNEQDKVLFVDVRSRVELQYFGVAKGIDANIPYYYVDQWHWYKKYSRFERIENNEFVSMLDRRLKDKGLSRNDRIVFICKSGARSKRAAKALFKQGFKNVYIITTGFDGNKVKTGAKKGQRVIDGWKNDGLPWRYKLDANKVFSPEELEEALKKPQSKNS